MLSSKCFSLSAVMLTFLIVVSGCVFKKNMQMEIPIDYGAVLYDCERYTSNLGLFFTGKQAVTCLDKSHPYAVTHTVSPGVVFRVSRLIEVDSIDGGLSGYLIGSVKDAHGVEHHDVFLYSGNVRQLTDDANTISRFR
jgi:hypothetical protein